MCADVGGSDCARVGRAGLLLHAELLAEAVALANQNIARDVSELGQLAGDVCRCRCKAARRPGRPHTMAAAPGARNGANGRGWGCRSAAANVIAAIAMAPAVAVCGAVEAVQLGRCQHTGVVLAGMQPGLE